MPRSPGVQRSQAKDMYWFAHGGIEPPVISQRQPARSTTPGPGDTEDESSENSSLSLKENSERRATSEELAYSAPNAASTARTNNNDKRQTVGERKRLILEAEQEKSDALLKKRIEREAALEARRNAQRNNISFAFGSVVSRNADGDTTARVQWSPEIERPKMLPATLFTVSSKTADNIMSQSMYASMSSARGRRKNDLTPTVPYDRTGPPRTAAPTRKRSVSMSRLDQLAQPRRAYVEAQKANSTISNSSSKEPRPSPPRPLSVASEKSSAPKPIMRRPTTSTRKPRPISIAGSVPDRVSLDKKSAKSNLTTKKAESVSTGKTYTSQLRASRAKSTSVERGKRLMKSTEKSKSSTKSKSPAPEKTTKSPPKSTKSSSKSATKPPASNKSSPKQWTPKTSPSRKLLTNKKQAAMLVSNVSDGAIQAVGEPVFTKPPSPVRSSTPEVDSTSTDDKSSSSKRIISEEEAKAALAEKRRLAREQAEKEAELERQRQEEIKLQEEEQMRLEEEQQKRLEEEQLQLLEQHREYEEEKLRKAIEEQQRKEEEEKLRREEEARLKSEQEKKSKEEAEKQRIEMEEKLRREEEERAERKKRLDQIMSRTRGKSGTASPGSGSGSEAHDSTESQPEILSSEPNSLDSNMAVESLPIDHLHETSASESLDFNQTVNLDLQSLSSNDLMIPSSGSTSMDNMPAGDPIQESPVHHVDNLKSDADEISSITQQLTDVTIKNAPSEDSLLSSAIAPEEDIFVNATVPSKDNNYTENLLNESCDVVSAISDMDVSNVQDLVNDQNQNIETTEKTPDVMRDEKDHGDTLEFSERIYDEKPSAEESHYHHGAEESHYHHGAEESQYHHNDYFDKGDFTMSDNDVQPLGENKIESTIGDFSKEIDEVSDYTDNFGFVSEEKSMVRSDTYVFEKSHIPMSVEYVTEEDAQNFYENRETISCFGREEQLEKEFKEEVKNISSIPEDQSVFVDFSEDKNVLELSQSKDHDETLKFQDPFSGSHVDVTKNTENYDQTSEIVKDIETVSDFTEDLRNIPDSFKDPKMSISFPQELEISSESPKRDTEIVFDIAKNDDKPINPFMNSEVIPSVSRSSEVMSDPPRSQEMISGSLGLHEMDDAMLDSPRSQDTSPRTDEADPESPKIYETDTESPRIYEIDDSVSDSPRSYEIVPDSPRTYEEEDDDVTSDSPHSQDSNLISPRSNDALPNFPRSHEMMFDNLASESPRDSEEAFDSPRNCEEAFDSPRNCEEASDSPRNCEEASDSPRNCEKASDSPRNCEETSDFSKHQEVLDSLTSDAPSNYESVPDSSSYFETKFASPKDVQPTQNVVKTEEAIADFSPAVKTVSNLEDLTQESVVTSTEITELSNVSSNEIFESKVTCAPVDVSEIKCDILPQTSSEEPFLSQNTDSFPKSTFLDNPSSSTDPVVNLPPPNIFSDKTSDESCALPLVESEVDRFADHGILKTVDEMNYTNLEDSNKHMGFPSDLSHEQSVENFENAFPEFPQRTANPFGDASSFLATSEQVLPHYSGSSIETELLMGALNSAIEESEESSLDSNLSQVLHVEDIVSNSESNDNVPSNTLQSSQDPFVPKTNGYNVSHNNGSLYESRFESAEFHADQVPVSPKELDLVSEKGIHISTVDNGNYPLDNVDNVNSNKITSNPFLISSEAHQFSTNPFDVQDDTKSIPT